MPSPEGNRPHNLDVSSLKPLPKREVGWGVKKPESQGIRGRDKPGEQRGQADRGAKPQPLEPIPAEQQARERLAKPPPEKPVQDQGEPQAGEQEEAEEIDFPVRVFPPATWVGPFGRKSAKRPKRD
jgi:hypothetical protein